MKRSVVVVVGLLFLFPAVSMAADEASFEGGQEEVIAELVAPGYEATVNLSIPAGYYVTNATMKVTGMAAENNASAYPEGVTVKLNDSVIWEFRGPGYGPLGRQDLFSNGKKQATSSFGANGGTKSQYIRLPTEAIVQCATMDVLSHPPASGFRLMNDTGAGELSRYGAVVADAGDVNGDGYDDVLANGLYLYYGAPSMDNIKDVAFSGASGDEFGDSFSGAGDVNGDGFDEIIVGASRNDSGGTDAGCAYIFFGSEDMDNVADVILTGLSAGDLLGEYVSGAGDVNGDGYDDVIVDARDTGSDYEHKGSAYIYFGGQNMDNVIDVDLAKDTTHWSFGQTCCGAGDVNGDGYDDVIVRSWINYSVHDIYAYIYLGGQNMDNKVDISLKISSNGLNLQQGLLSGAGDVNKDGYDDVIIGDCDANKVYLFYGNTTMDTTADVVFFGGAEGAHLGWSVSGAGDVNEDGWDDVVVGAPLSNKVCVYLGSDEMDNVSDYNFTEPEGSLGNSVSAAGDVNNDGYGDIIVGAPENNSVARYAGAICVYSCHASNVTGILNPGIAIGSSSVWGETGYHNQSASIGDFAKEVNAYLESASVSGKDQYGNTYVDIPIVLNVSSEGTLALSNLTLIYLYDAEVQDFTSKLVNYLASHEDQKDANGTTKVPLSICARSAGRVKLSGLDIDLERDMPPTLVRDIGDFELLEDSWNSSLIDLYAYFQDDFDRDTKLRFSVVSHTGQPYVTVGIRNERYVAADASTGDENDNWTGTVLVKVDCTDTTGQRIESNPFRIIVTNVNDEPVITSIPPGNAKACVLYRYNMTAVDGDDDKLRFSLIKAPVNMTLDEDSGQITWMPRARGMFNVTAAVSDGTFSVEQEFSAVVPNTAPRFTSTPVLNGTTGILYSYTVTAEDDNLDDLTYSLTSKIIGMEIGKTSGVIAWTPTYVNDYDVVVVVSDGTATTMQEFIVKVVQGNRAPKFISVPVKTAVVGLTYEYQAKAMDEDKDGVSFSLVEPPAGMTIEAGKVAWTPSAAGSFAVKIKASDGRGGEKLQEFVIEVKEKVRPTVSIQRPVTNEKVKGRFTVSGTAIKGTLEVASVQVRLDGGDWVDAAGNYTWQYGLDTTKMKNGKHSLEARAFDGKDYSDIVKVDFSVDNQKAPAKGFIPMIEGYMILLLLAAACALVSTRRQKRM